MCALGSLRDKYFLLEQITALAELPPREVLLGRMLSSMQSPMAGLVGVLQGVLRQLVYVLQAVKDAKEQAGSGGLADRQKVFAMRREEQWRLPRKRCWVLSKI